MKKFASFLNKTFGPGKPFNSCNAWGFGGGVGTVWSNDRITVKLFTAHYRRFRPENVVTIEVDGFRIVDELRSKVDFDDLQHLVLEYNSEPAH